MGDSSPAAEKRKEEIVAWLEADGSQEAKDAAEAFVMKNLERIDGEIATLRSQIDETAYKLIPWKYIAENYFGKSQSWLAQRVNGYSVRGRRYTLSAEQKETLNRALSEVGALIGSFQVA